MISTKFDLEVLDQIYKNLKYKDDTNFVNKPSEDSKFLYQNESLDDECYVWAGFVPPGSHQVTITDPINGTFQDKFFIGNRQKDLILS